MKELFSKIKQLTAEYPQAVWCFVCLVLANISTLVRCDPPYQIVGATTGLLLLIAAFVLFVVHMIKHSDD